MDTTRNASASLTVNSTPLPPPPPLSCTAPVELARWAMPTSGQGSGGPPPPYSSKATDVATAIASYTTQFGAQNISTVIGNSPNAWGGTAPTAANNGDGWSETPTSMNNYFQFILDTTNYGGVYVTFDGRPDNNGDWANPNSNVYVNTRADAGPFSVYQISPGVYPQAAKNAWTSLSAFAASTGTSTTTFRFGVDGSGNKKDGATFYLDNVVFWEYASSPWSS